MKQKYFAGALCFGMLAGAFTFQLRKQTVVEAAGVQAPQFVVDPLWPKPLPNHWILGAAIGVVVDPQDHIWILHRDSLEPREKYVTWSPPASECCSAAPPVLEFNEAGDLLASWGGPGEGYDWPGELHGIFFDYKGNIWIGGSGRRAPGVPAPAPGSGGGRPRTAPSYDNMVLKFTQSGKFLLQIGHPNKSTGSNDTENPKQPAKAIVDPQTNEVYVADGYGNRRVVVYDADTGAYKRHWGAYGHRPDDTIIPAYSPNDPLPQQFGNVHCVMLAQDRLLYVCDRTNDRIQVFKTDGTFVQEGFISKNTLADGSVFDIAFSKDPEQKYLYIADGSNMKIHVVERKTLEDLTTFGGGGRQPGEFYAVHSIATDSKGNIFTTETYRGQRVQKFLYKGLAPVTKKDQGVVWPKVDKP
jgi:hypothetical protein